MINCLWIDDEPLALHLPQDYVSRVPYLRFGGKFDEPLKALDFLQAERLDLLLRDIKMPDISGVDFFKLLPLSDNCRNQLYSSIQYLTE